MKAKIDLKELEKLLKDESLSVVDIAQKLNVYPSTLYLNPKYRDLMKNREKLLKEDKKSNK